MTNAIVGTPRWTEKFTFSGPLGTADYPVTNVGILPLAKVARSPDTAEANTWILAVSDKPRRLGLIGLTRYNFSLSAKARLTIYLDAAATELLYDSGWVNVWPEGVYPYTTLEWEDDNWWSGGYTEDQIDNRRSFAFWLAEQHIGQSFKIAISDIGNAAGYVELGLIEPSGGTPYSLNFDFGANYGFRFRTKGTEADGGVQFFNRKDKPRTFKGTITQLNRDEALARGFEQQWQMDLDTPFFWLPHPDEPVHWLRTAFLARNTADVGLFAYNTTGMDDMPISIEEVL